MIRLCSACWRPGSTTTCSIICRTIWTTVIGQNALLEDFGKGAFSFIVVENMPEKDVAALQEKLESVEHVETVLWYNSLMDTSIPMQLLPDKLYDAFNTGDATMMAVFFDTATSADETMDAIREIRSIAGKQCFVSGMSALVTDLKDLCEQEEPIYIAIAVVLACVAMMLFLDSWLIRSCSLPALAPPFC